MSNNKKTAVEWFIRELEKQGVRYFRLSEKALKMEKKQQKYFFDCGRQYQLTGEGTFNQVHNETYGGKDGE
jgi:hypothetical protein